MAMPHRADRVASRAERLEDCAVRGTVIGTAASAGYAEPLRQLAMSAASVGFACVAVQPMDSGFPWGRHTLLEAATHFRVLADLPTPFFPRPRWCVNSSTRYGWRRSHVYRMLLWRNVLTMGFDLLALDCDWVLRADPLRTLRAAHVLVSPPNATNSTNPFTRVLPSHAEPADFVALVHDGVGRRQLNIGVVFIRASARTVSLARAAFNRSYGAQDQIVVNEELNWGEANVSCCFLLPPMGLFPTYRQPLNKHCARQAAASFAKNDSTHNIKNRERSHAPSIKDGRACVPASQIPPAGHPPPLSHVTWYRSSGEAEAPVSPKRPKIAAATWEPSAYNQRTGVGSFGRCTRLDNACGCARAESLR